MAAAENAQRQDAEKGVGERPSRGHIGSAVSWLLFSAGILLLGLAGAAVGIWIHTMPYPLKVYMEARRQTRYSPQWPVSKEEYRQAWLLVEERLSKREIIGEVTVVSQTRIEFGTLKYYSGPLAAAGERFVAEKVKGVWIVTHSASWVS